MTWQPDAYVSFKDRGQFGKHLIHKCSGELLKTLTVPRLQIQGTGWSQRTIPVVRVPAPSRETANPATRAKLPPEVMGTTIGTCVTLLKASGDTTSTGRVPCCSWPAVGLKPIQDKCRRAASDQFLADRGRICPAACVNGQGGIGIALGQQFLHGIPLLGFRADDQASAFHHQIHRGT